MVYGLWSMVYGLWSMVYGLWYMVYGLWSMVYGLWSMMVYGPWFMVYSLWSMVHHGHDEYWPNLLALLGMLLAHIVELQSELGVKSDAEVVVHDGLLREQVA